MIRDPSDGSVKVPEEISPDANEINSVVAKTRSKEITSGLPTSKLNAKEIAKLEKARDWLRDWNRKKLEGGK